MAAFVPQDYIDKIYAGNSPDEVKKTLALSGPHDNHHDFKTNRDDLLKELKGDFMCFPTDKFDWTSTDDAFLEHLGITRKDATDDPNAVYKFKNNFTPIQEVIANSYNFYYHNGSDNPIIQLIAALGGNTDDDTHTYDLVVDTQYYFLRNLIKARLSKKFNFLENEATVFDPAKKMRPKSGTKGGKYLSFVDNENSDIKDKSGNIQKKIKFRAEEGSQIIPEITGDTPNCEYTDTNNHNILFSSKLPISVFTNGTENLKDTEKNNGKIIKEAYAIVENERDRANPYLVPHTFTEINAGTPGFALFNKIIKKTKACMLAMTTQGNAAAIAKYHLSNFEKPRERTPIHYLMKRLGDALQALTCYIETPSKEITSKKKLKWFVTLDTPCFGISLLYKTPVVIFCNNVTGYAGELNTDFKNITVAVRSDLLSDKAKAAAQIAAEERRKQVEEEKQAALAALAEKKSALVFKVNQKIEAYKVLYQPQMEVDDDDKAFDNLKDILLNNRGTGMGMYIMYKLIENKLLFTSEKGFTDKADIIMNMNIGIDIMTEKIEQLIMEIEKEYNRRKKSEKLIENLYDELQDDNLPNKIGNVAVFPAHTFLKRKKLKEKLVKNGILVKVDRKKWQFNNENQQWYVKNIPLFANTVWDDVVNPPTQFGGKKEYTGGDYGHISIIDYYKKITESLFLIQKSLFNHFYHYFNLAHQHRRLYEKLNRDVLGPILDYTVEINEAIPKIREDIKQKIEDKFNQNISTPPDEEMEAFLFYLSLYDEAEGVEDKINLNNLGDIEIDETIVDNVCVAKRFHECIIYYDDDNPFSVIRDKIDRWCKNTVPPKKKGKKNAKRDDDHKNLYKRGVDLNKGRLRRQETAKNIRQDWKRENIKRRRRTVRGVQNDTPPEVYGHHQYFYDLVHDIQILHDDYEGMLRKDFVDPYQLNLGVGEDVGTMDQEDDADDNDKYLDKVKKIFALLYGDDSHTKYDSDPDSLSYSSDNLGGKRRKTKKRRRRVKKKRRTRKKKSKKKKIKKSKNTKKNKKKKPKKKIRRSMKRSKIMKNLVK